MLVDKFRKLGFDIDQRIEIRESDQYGKHICATEKIEKGKLGLSNCLYCFDGTQYAGLTIVGQQHENIRFYEQRNNSLQYKYSDEVIAKIPASQLITLSNCLVDPIINAVCEA